MRQLKNSKIRPMNRYRKNRWMREAGPRRSEVGGRKSAEPGLSYRVFAERECATCGRMGGRHEDWCGKAPWRGKK